MRPETSVRVTVKPNTYVYLVMLIFFVPLKWMAAWLIAVSVHELSHYVGVKLCGGEVLEFSVGVGGAHMVCSPLENRRKLFSVLSGPIGGFALVLLGRWFPRTALCSWLLSVYNFLPLLNLDGGRALEILFGQRRASVVEKITLGLLSLAALYMAIILRFGFLPLAIVCILWLKSRKSPCKLRARRVQ